MSHRTPEPQLSITLAGGETMFCSLNLIAAAPEMLEALKAVLHFPDLIYTGGDFDSLDACGHYGTQALVTQIRAAIAKAEGQ